MTGRSLFLPLHIPLLLCLLLAACSLPVAHRASGSDQQNSQATQAALLVETEIARALNTATPTPVPSATIVQPSATPDADASATAAANATPAAPVIQITPLAGMALFTNPALPEYVFQVDPETWAKDPSGETANLVHASIAGCEVQSVPGHGLGEPQRYFWQDLGRFRWEVMDYGSNAFVIPVQGAGLSEQGGSFLALQGYNRAKCRAAQEKVLKNLMLASEASGKLAFTAYASPTPRAALENFTCADAPEARLRVGDWVSVVTNALWLRSEARADNSTKLHQYPRSAPVVIKIVGGPVCEKYVYWQVEVSTFGEGGQTVRGWMAEGDTEEYYLVKVK
jgi:hypothetical protein